MNLFSSSYWSAWSGDGLRDRSSKAPATASWRTSASESSAPSSAVGCCPSWASTSAPASFRPSSRPPSVRSFSWSFCGSLTAGADGDLPSRLVPSLPLQTADLADRPAQAGDELLAAGEMGVLGGENRSEPPLLERQHVDPIRFGIDPRRVAYAVDEP